MTLVAESWSDNYFLLPFKYTAACRHRIPRAGYRNTNWPAYEAGLRRRGHLTLWLDEAALAAQRAVMQSLLKAGLLEEIEAEDNQLAFRITQTGLDAIIPAPSDTGDTKPPDPEAQEVGAPRDGKSLRQLPLAARPEPPFRFRPRRTMPALTDSLGAGSVDVIRTLISQGI